MLVCERLEGRSSEGDLVHRRLKAEVEKRRTSYLWVPGDTPPFKPALLPLIYGDGRALFALATLNQRPHYWVIRGCSTWRSDLDSQDGTGAEFGELTDEILTDLEEAFGNGRCGYSGGSLFWSRRERMKNCQCEDCSDRFVAKWPMVDGSGGCSWSRMDWPESFPTEPNPLSWEGNLLAAKTQSPPNPGDRHGPPPCSVPPISRHARRKTGAQSWHKASVGGGAAAGPGHLPAACFSAVEGGA